MLGNDLIIVILQNGAYNQDILPKFFKRVIYAIVAYNCWIKEPGVVEFQSKGPLYLGTKENQLFYKISEINEMFSQAFPSHITFRLQDAVHNKIVLNLTNALLL